MSGGDSLINSLGQTDSTKREFDLDNWITDFEMGFPTTIAKTNLQLQLGYWGQGFENRPKIRELNLELEAQKKEGYRVIEFLPNRSNEEESYLLFGTPLELMTQLSFVMAIHRMVDRRDIGEFVGYPLSEYYKGQAQSDISVVVWLTTKKQPPFYASAYEWFSRRKIEIPLVNKAKLTYKNLRIACNDSIGLDFGEYHARGYLKPPNSEKVIYQMVCGGDTEDSAKKNLERFLPFTRAKLQGMSINKIDYNEGERAQWKDKLEYNKFKVYPAFIWVNNPQLFASDTKAANLKKTLVGKQKYKKTKLWLYFDKEPSGWNAQLKESLKTITLANL